MVTLVVHVLAALPYELYPGREHGLSSRPQFLGDNGCATEDSLLQFGQRLSKNFVFLDAAFELAYLCYYGFKKKLKVVHPVLGETSSQDRVVVHNLIHGGPDKYDPEAIYLFFVNANHFFPLLPVGGLSVQKRVDITKFKVPRSHVSITLRQFVIDYKEEFVRG